MLNLFTFYKQYDSFCGSLMTEGGCGDPGTPENGRKLGVTYSVNSKVYFDCDLGYELEGSADRKCQLNGTWTGIQPVCKGKVSKICLLSTLYAINTTLKFCI